MSPPTPSLTCRPTPLVQRLCSTASDLLPLLRLLRLVLLLLLTAAGVSRAFADEAMPASVIALKEARFTHSDQEPVETVRLPHTWPADNRSTRIGHYRVTIDLPTAPTVMWAICLERLSDVHEVSLNGWLVDGTPLRPQRREPVSGGQPTMSWIPVPPHLLRAGLNVIDLSVAHDGRGGLSPIMVGPADVMMPGYVTAQRLTQILPIWLNVAGTALAVFMMLIWWRRRDESLLGSFGALWTLIAASNLAYYTRVPWPSVLADYGFYAAQVLVTALLCHTTMVLTNRPQPILSATLKVSIAVLLMMGAWGGLNDSLDEVRAWSYPMMFIGVLMALSRLWPEMQYLRPGARWVPLLAVGLSMAAALHDYAFWRGLSSVMDFYWLPYALPVTLAILGGVLIKRLVHALHEVEMLNTSLERRVIERTEALQQANQAKTRFLTAASHDLRQPVVTIGLLIDLLREQVPVALRPMTERVNEAVSSMEDLLKGLLDLSRLEAGTVRPRLQTIALQPMFDAIAAHEREAARQKNITLRLRPTNDSVESDPVMLEQMLRNLVSNAVRYTEHGGVLVGARRRAGYIRIEVWDTGHGIAAAHQRTIFDEFVQLDAEGAGHPLAAHEKRLDDGGRGLGLGLSIVQRSAALLGHRVGLRSRLDHGSCFSIMVPQSMPVPPLPVTHEGHDRPLEGLRLTVVEDEPTVQAALQSRLIAWGAVVQCHEGLTSLRRRLAQRPRGHSGIDLLITDQRLRGATGLDVVAAVRSYGGPVPVLVITGDTAAADLTLLAASGLQVLHKPFRADALLMAIQQALSQAPAPAPAQP